MFERLASVNQFIKNVFVVGIKGFSYNSDELLKETPDSLGNGELDNPIGCFVKESSDSLIGGETLDCAQNVVLKYSERYADKQIIKTHTFTIACLTISMAF